MKIARQASDANVTLSTTRMTIGAVGGGGYFHVSHTRLLEISAIDRTKEIALLRSKSINHRLVVDTAGNGKGGGGSGRGCIR